MRRGFWWVTGGGAAFLIVIVARFPARWLAWTLPRGVECRAVAGSLWSGACLGLHVAAMPVGDLHWTLHPLRLFMGRLSLSVALTRPLGHASAQLEVSPSGTLAAHRVSAKLSLDHAVFPQLPPGFHGNLEAHLASLSWRSNQISTLQGQIEARDLVMQGGENLGGYRVEFSGRAPTPLTGRLYDLGGPFSVRGTVRLTQGPGYVVTGLIAARPNAPPDLAAQLRYLGTPDAQGRRQFSVAGTL